MLGYCSKDEGLAHYKVHRHNVTDEEIEVGKEVYILEGGKHVRGKVQLEKRVLLPRMLHYWQVRLKSEAGLRVEDVILHMMRSGQYYLSAEFVDARGGGVCQVSLDW